MIIIWFSRQQSACDRLRLSAGFTTLLSLCIFTGEKAFASVTSIRREFTNFFVFQFLGAEKLSVFSSSFLFVDTLRV